VQREARSCARNGAPLIRAGGNANNRRCLL
jgi:hypothetical protein